MRAVGHGVATAERKLGVDVTGTSAANRLKRHPSLPMRRRADGGRAFAAVRGTGTGGRSGTLASSGRRAAAAVLLVAFAALGALPLQAQAQTPPTEVPSDWPLTPTGLATDDTFRLLFLSSTKRKASSSDIADYNTFIQNRVAAGHAAIQAYGEGFRVVGCTAATDARDNTGTTYTASDTGVPIYWLNGVQAADDYEDFYDGSWDEEAHDKDESGADGPDTSLHENRPLTGCDHDGTVSVSSDSTYPLGGSSSSDLVRHGIPNSTVAGDGPLRGSTLTDTSQRRPMYGLSAVFKVGASSAATDATLSDLALKDDNDVAIPLIPGFASNTTMYSASTGFRVGEITVVPEVNESNARYRIQDAGGTVLTDADSIEDDFQVALVDGANTIKVEVTAQDATTTRTYTVTVTRASPPSLNPLVTNLGQSAEGDVGVSAVYFGVYSGIGQTFRTGPNLRGYRIDSINIDVSQGDPDGLPTVSVMEAGASAWADVFSLLPLDAGATSTTGVKTFYAPPDATLSPNKRYLLMVVGSTSLSPDSNGDGGLKLNTTASDAEDSSSADGWSIHDKRARWGNGIDTDNHDNSLLISIDGSAIDSSDVTLSALGLEDATGNTVSLSPGFAPGTTSYTASAGGTVAEITVSATLSNSSSTIAYLDGTGTAIADADANTPGWQVPLSVGENTIELKVTATDGLEQTYTLVVTRPCGDVWCATLKVKSLNNGHVGCANEGSSGSGKRCSNPSTLTDNDFTHDSTDYSVTKLRELANGTLQIDFNADLTTATQSLVLHVGSRTFAFQDADTQNVKRREWNNAGLNWSAGDSVALNLTASGIVSTDATLTGLELKNASDDSALPLNEMFASTSTSYTADVANGVTSITIEPARSDSGAAVAYLDASDAALADANGGTAGFQVDLSEGDTTIKVKVTAADTSTTETYTLVVTRAGAGATPTVTISADKTSAVFRDEGITWTLTRTGSTAAALPVTVALTQTRDFLAAAELTKTVTIDAGQSEKTFTVAATRFREFAQGATVAGGTLTATVQDGTGHDPGTPASVEVSIVVALTIGFEMASYTIAEEDGSLAVKLVARTGAGAAQPDAGFLVTFSTQELDPPQALSGPDYDTVSDVVSFAASDFSAAGSVFKAEKTLSITIHDDAADEEAESFNVIVEPSPSLSGKYANFVDPAGLACQDTQCATPVTITDDDTAGVTVSKTTLAVTEEDATGDSYTVVLDSEPGAHVTVTVAGHAGTDVTLTPDPPTLTFTDLTWDTARTVTVKAADDADPENDSVSLTHSATSTDGDYDGITIAGVTVTVTDNDTTAGICVRTPAVRAAILDEISGINACADVTDVHLAAIDSLALGSKSITTVAAGDFAGLTALTLLDLSRNALITLPSGVFAGLGALTELDLVENRLTTLDADVFDSLTSLETLNLAGSDLASLPAGVFDQLTSLRELYLGGNDLASLPAGVFEPLAALTDLSLAGNPGAPFSPTADALPDDGEVSFAGGDVTLDGSGSDGGPWGTNVTYSWAASGAAVTFDDAASATPVVTIPALADGTELTFTLTVTGRATNGNGTAPDTDTATVTAVFDPTAGICGRTEAVRDAIVARISGVTACADVTDAHLAAITGNTLNLETEGITALAAGDFDGLTALTELSLKQNSLETLPAGVFDELTALTYLILQNNSLTTLPAGVFDGLTSLTWLQLSGNSLETLPAGVFDELTALTRLWLSGNSLPTLPAGVFDELTALTELWLANNSLPTLPAGVFDELTALTTLILNDNSLTALPAGVFDELTALTTLRLADNPGAPFSPTADALPDDGTVLDAGGDVTLDGSGSDGGPWGTNVTYSWAASGAAVTFDDAASATPVVTIPALADGTELTFTLTVTGRATNTSNGSAPATATATVTAEFDPTAGICGRTEQVRDAILARISGVTHCALVTDAHLAAITGTLDLRLDGITTALAAGDFDGLTALTTLDLSSNSLTTLPTGVFDGLTALTGLWLYNNSLSTLPAGVFDGLTALTQLWLNGNSLETLPAGVFDELTALTTLRLNGNSLETLPAGVFDKLTALTQLFLNNNSLTTLPAGAFEELTALTTLRLDGNPGAPFSPTADALPDDGEVSFTGDTVTLDGSGSGGPWGTNVTYSWALTSPTSGVTVTFDDAASATPVVTIPALADGAELTFTLTVTGRGGTNGIDPATDTAMVTAAILGICGRTEAVRDGIVRLFGNITHCADITDAHLAAITGSLDLRNDNITALAAGDFDGLTALTTLNLGSNSLTTLPAGVFDGLTALTGLYLGVNSLETLPAGVFNELTALTELQLEGNSLSSLPDDVFEELTSLTTLQLQGNPGAPFSPTADALPDDGEVSFTGGTVTLDGSGSGGAWGTNVTYAWALTTPASGTVFDAVTFDDDTSATPVVTIPALTAGTELTFTLTVTGRATNASRGSAPATDTAMVTATASNDAKLGDLAVNDGTNDLTLTPPFASGTFAYEADVANAVDEVTLAATLSHTGASVSAVTLNGTGIVDSDFTDGIAVPSLLVGDNEIVVTVTAQDDATTQPYTLTLARAEAIAVTVSFEHGTYTVAEGGTEDVKVKLSADPERTVTIALTATGQDGADAGDYSVGSSAVTFNSGEMEKTFSFTATQDSVDDDGESVKLGFLNLPTGVTAGSTGEATVSITDDDSPPAVQVPGDVSVTEGAGTAQVAVGLSAASGKTVTVDWATADDSAVAGSDYTAASGTLTFDPGVTSMTITVAILDDGVPEPQESLDVILSNAANATLPAHATVAVTIGNDDGTAATGKPAISGTAHARETLTASTGTIMDDDGLINVAYSYQWIRVAGSVETDISGETGSTYVVRTADVGNKVKVAVSFTDDAGNAEALTSDAWPQSGTIGALIPLEVGWETINKSYAEDEESPEIAMVLHSGAPVGNASIAADLVLTPITANDDPADGNQDYVWGVDSTPLVIPPGGTRAVYAVQLLDDGLVENIERFRVRADQCPVRAGGRGRARARFDRDAVALRRTGVDSRQRHHEHLAGAREHRRRRGCRVRGDQADRGAGRGRIQPS